MGRWKLGIGFAILAILLVAADGPVGRAYQGVTHVYTVDMTTDIDSGVVSWTVKRDGVLWRGPITIRQSDPGNFMEQFRTDLNSTVCNSIYMDVCRAFPGIPEGCQPE